MDGVRPRTQRTERQAPRRTEPVRVPVVSHEAPVDYRPLVETSTVASEQRVKKTRSRFRILIPVLLALVVDVLFINHFDTARMTVRPHEEVVDISRELTLVRDGGTGELEFSLMAIPETQSVEVSPDTNEQVERYAQGSIRVFNDYSTEPQRLSPQTRFQSVDGKVYKSSDEEIIIPGKNGSIPGEVTITVYAREPGDAYNIGPTDFSLPGLLELGLNDKYAHIYALSTDPFTGGFVGTQPAISESRKESVQKDLEQKLQTSLKEKLLLEQPEQLILIDGTPTIVFNEPRFVVDSDGEGTLSLTGIMYAALVSSDELGAYLAPELLGLDSDETVSVSGSETVRIHYGGSVIDFHSLDKLPVTLTGYLGYRWGIDEKTLLNNLAGVRFDVLPTLVDRMRSIGAITIKNQPRWRRHVPTSPDNIDLSIVSL